MNAAENPAATDDARRRLAREFHALGVRPDDTLMVHASIRSVGPIAGGAKTLLSALRDAVGVGGTLMGFASWRDSPHEETLDGRELPPERREAWPAFDPLSAAVYSGFGMFNELIRMEPDASRSAHPDASMVAVGRHARWLTAHHAFDDAYGPTSPLGRLVEASGRVILLGAPLDSVTILHLAEAVARIPGKRHVSYEMPVLEQDGRKTWVRCSNFDSNGILDCFAMTDGMDAVESMARAYVKQCQHAVGKVGEANCRLFEARDLVAFGVKWLEERFGADGSDPALGDSGRREPPRGRRTRDDPD